MNNLSLLGYRNTWADDFPGEKQACDDPSDLAYALLYNDVKASSEFVVQVLGYISGANDGPDWHWLVLLDNGKIAYLRGGCDYTGWDCQSYVDLINEYDTLEQALSTLGLPSDCVNGDLKIRDTFRTILEGKNV